MGGGGGEGRGYGEKVHREEEARDVLWCRGAHESQLIQEQGQPTEDLKISIPVKRWQHV